MASRQATKRLNKEYKSIQANPPPYIIAHPSEDNILEWHYVLTGPQDTPYEGGQYHGLLRFPPQYPFQPPSILMITPSGRFKPNTRICLSMSDYHPDTWNPAWSVLTILTGMLSFFTGEESTTGSINTSVNHRKVLAQKSKNSMLIMIDFVENSLIWLNNIMKKLLLKKLNWNNKKRNNN